MQRLIKFRAWDSVGKKMLYNVGIENNDIYLITHTVSNLVYFELCNNLIPMQFTGLKDKNGMDIYEGDILKTNGEDGDVNWQVIWAEKRLQIEFKCLDDGRYSSCYNHVETESIIIGNIYENTTLSTIKL